MKIKLLSLALATLVGCSSFDYPIPELQEPEHGTLVLVEYRRNDQGYDYLREYGGVARIYDMRIDLLDLPKTIRKCDIIVRDYPVAMGHEITHCFSGNFHDTPETEHYKYSLWD